MKLSRFLTTAATLALASLGTSANAASFSFNFTDTSSQVLASGFLTTADTLNALGGYDLTSISGTVTGFGAITGFVPINTPLPGTSSANGFLYNNTVYTSAYPHVDLNGLLFSTAGASWNVYRNGTDVFTGFDGTNYIPNSSGTQFAGTFTITAVPEPASWAMMIAGFGLLGATMRRRRVSVSYAA